MIAVQIGSSYASKMTLKAFQNYCAITINEVHELCIIHIQW